jgi:hypothetical protein
MCETKKERKQRQQWLEFQPLRTVGGGETTADVEGMQASETFTLEFFMNLYAAAESSTSGLIPLH